MYTDKIVLADNLKHPGYSWPRSLVTYPVSLNMGLTPDMYQLIDENLENMHFQFTDVPDEKGAERPNICFTAELSYGTEHTYQLKQMGSESTKVQKGMVYDESEEKTITMSNQSISLIVNRKMMAFPEGKYHIFSIVSISDGIICDVCLNTALKPVAYSIRMAAKGCVFADCIIEIQFACGSFYTIRLRIAEGMEFIEMQESVAGFDEGDDTKLLLEWNNFNPEERYICSRGYEKIDQYNEKEYLPFKLMPYSNWVNWWETKAAAFTDYIKGKSVGVFVKNADKWDDGKYALWSSPDTHAISFRYMYSPESEGRLVWECPIANGSRSTSVAIYASCKDKECQQKSYIDYLWFWYEYINLDKVKNWVLRWDEDKNSYPRFFPEESIPEPGVDVWHYGVRKEPFSPEFVEEMVYKLSQNMNRLYEVGPVAAREFFSWVYVFDMAAPKMTQKQFDDLKACCAFMAYAHMEENFMPIGKVLAGHPNFLADVRSVPALMASLFPGHPHCSQWVHQFEKAMTLNFKYHLRPDVKAWDSKGGRWTENLGCYNFAFLTPAIKTATLVQKSLGENILMSPYVENWVRWMLDSLTAPVNGKRAYPPQGAHSGHYLDPMIPVSPMRFLAERLFQYNPLLSEYLLYLCKPDAPSFEEKIPGTDIYKYLYDRSLKENNGTRLHFKSSKYTGYGYVLRASFGEESEVSVHLQQIDEGPNYRWGRAGQGGCGVIYYNAAGKRYSYNRPEDVGDANMSDVQGCCNFGTLDGHEYKSVGRNDLTEPMYDFGFAQYAQVNAGEYSQPFYKSRSVLLSGNDYIIIYDSVGDMRVSGRFAWFVKDSEELPQIVQLKPGAAGVPVGPGVPAEEYGNHVTGRNNSRGIIFDGSGDFLTLVSHRLLNSEFNTFAGKTCYGAEVRLAGRTDRIFRDSALIRHEDSKCCFTGYAGIVRLYGDNRAEAALFKGIKIGAPGVEVSIVVKESEEPSAGISFSMDRGKLAGKATCYSSELIKVKFSDKLDKDNFKLYLDSLQHEISFIDDNTFIFKLPAGSHTWQWTDSLPVPEATRVAGTVAESGGVLIKWQEANGASGYQVEISRDCGKSWSMAIVDIKGSSCRLSGLTNGTKLHIRIRGFNEDCHGEWSPDYPVYITDRAPFQVEGLKVWRDGSKFRIIWGRQLGISGYKLYKREKGTESFDNIYYGTACEYIDICPDNSRVYEYAVSAVNGNGEGDISNIRDTEPDGPAYWDPQPEAGFRRYTVSHEYGYNGFDHWSNSKKSELTYPV